MGSLPSHCLVWQRLGFGDFCLFVFVFYELNDRAGSSCSQAALLVSPRVSCQTRGRQQQVIWGLSTEIELR